MKNSKSGQTHMPKSIMDLSLSNSDLGNGYCEIQIYSCKRLKEEFSGEFSNRRRRKRKLGQVKQASKGIDAGKVREVQVLNGLILGIPQKMILEREKRKKCRLVGSSLDRTRYYVFVIKTNIVFIFAPKLTDCFILVLNFCVV